MNSDKLITGHDLTGKMLFEMSADELDKCCQSNPQLKVEIKGWIEATNKVLSIAGNEELPWKRVYNKILADKRKMNIINS